MAVNCWLIDDWGLTALSAQQGYIVLCQWIAETKKSSAWDRMSRWMTLKRHCLAMHSKMKGSATNSWHLKRVQQDQSVGRPDTSERWVIGPRYCSIVPRRTLYVSTAILHCIRSGTSSQCRLVAAPLMWSEHRRLEISHATAFRTDQKLRVRYTGMPMSTVSSFPVANQNTRHTPGKTVHLESSGFTGRRWWNTGRWRHWRRRALAVHFHLDVVVHVHRRRSRGVWWSRSEHVASAVAHSSTETSSSHRRHCHTTQPSTTTIWLQLTSGGCCNETIISGRNINNSFLSLNWHSQNLSCGSDLIN